MLLTRCGWLTGVLAVVVVVVAAPSAPRACSQVIGPDFPTALIAVAHLAALTVAGWILLVLIGALAHVRLPGVPRALRSALIVPAAVGVISAVAVAGPAHADQRHDVAGLPLPDRPVATAPLERTEPVAPRPSSPDAATITVRPGDSLWSLAAADLPAGASTRQVTASWHAWYATNRDVVGADPDLIVPGQVLIVPDAAPTEQDAS